jgi:hypothetical protein
MLRRTLRQLAQLRKDIGNIGNGAKTGEKDCPDGKRFGEIEVATAGKRP